VSTNLHLRGVSLFQTPTTVTYAATAEGADPRAVYFGWLDDWVETSRPRPKIHPRMRPAQRKAATSTPDYKKWLAWKEQVEEHKRAIDRHLAGLRAQGQLPDWYET